MPKRPAASKKLHRWRISRIRSTPAREIGYVEAADAEQAIQEAVSHMSRTITSLRGSFLPAIRRDTLLNWRACASRKFRCYSIVEADKIMSAIKQFFIDAWTYKVSLAPVFVTYLLFDAQAIYRKVTKTWYVPIYFIVLPKMATLNKLYAEYFSEDDYYGVGSVRLTPRSGHFGKKLSHMRSCRWFLQPL